MKVLTRVEVPEGAEPLPPGVYDCALQAVESSNDEIRITIRPIHPPTVSEDQEPLS